MQSDPWTKVCSSEDMAWDNGGKLKVNKCNRFVYVVETLFAYNRVT